MRTFALIAAMACAASLAAAPPAAAQHKMTTYQLVMLRKGPAAATASTPAGEAIVKDHVSWVYKLAADGQVMAAGPFTDGGDFEGILIVKADTPEKAIELETGDPGVKGGIFVMEALPFMSPNAGSGSGNRSGRSKPSTSAF